MISEKQVFSLKKYANGTCDSIRAPPRREDQKGIDDRTWNRLCEPYRSLGSDGIVECGVYVKVSEGCESDPLARRHHGEQGRARQHRRLQRRYVYVLCSSLHP